MERKLCIHCNYYHPYLPGCPWTMHVDRWPVWFKEQVQHLEKKFFTGRNANTREFWNRYYVLIMEWNYREKKRAEFRG